LQFGASQGYDSEGALLGFSFGSRGEVKVVELVSAPEGMSIKQIKQKKIIFIHFLLLKFWIYVNI
jgi:hypothetical protein